MAIPRYQAKDIAVKPSTRAIQAQSQALSTLTQRIEAFSGVAQQAYEKETQTDAVKQAEGAFLSDGLDAATIKENGLYAETYNERLSSIQNQQSKLNVSTKAQEFYTANPFDPLAFEKNFDAYQKTYLNGVDENRRLDVGLQFAAEKASYLSKVNVNALNKVKEAEVSTANEFTTTTSNSMENAARQLNIPLAKYKAEELIAHIDEQVRLKNYSSETGRKLKSNAEFSLLSNSLYGKSDYYIQKKDYDSVVNIIDDLKTKQTDQYSVEQRDSMIATMQRDLSHAIKQDKASGEKSTRIISDEYNKSVKARKNGDVYKNQEGVNNSSLNDAQRVNNQEWNSLQPELTTYKGLPLKQQTEILNEYERKGAKTGVELKRLDAMRSINARLKKDINENAIDAAVKQGYAKKPVQQLTDFSREGMKALTSRVDIAYTAKSVYGKTTGVLTNAEATYLSERWGSMNTDEKGVFTMGVVENLPPDLARATLGQLNKKRSDNLFIAGNLLIEGKKGTANEIMQGNKIIQEKLDGTAPKGLTTAITASLSAPLGSIIASDPNTFNGYANAIKSVYINRALSKGQDPTMIDDDLLEEVTNDVTGGIVKINGKSTIVPKHGMNEGDMKTWWKDLSPFDIQAMGGIKFEGDPLEAPKMFEIIKEDGELIPAGQGKYRIKVAGHFVQNKQGSNLIVTYGGE